MGSSPPELIPHFVWAIRTIVPFPKTLIDMGCGDGLYGYLFKSYTRHPTEAKVYGLDINMGCKLEKFYDDIILHDLEDPGGIGIRIEEYETTVWALIEVIEHLSKERGRILLDSLGKLRCPLIISTPTHFYQSNTPEKEGSAHKELWTSSELDDVLKKYYNYHRERTVYSDSYRTEHSFHVFEMEPYKPIPEGIRDR